MLLRSCQCEPWALLLPVTMLTSLARSFFGDVVELPSSFEQLRTTSAGDGLRVLVDHLCKTCTNPTIVNALLCASNP